MQCDECETEAGCAESPEMSDCGCTVLTDEQLEAQCLTLCAVDARWLTFATNVCTHGYSAATWRWKSGTDTRVYTARVIAYMLIYSHTKQTWVPIMLATLLKDALVDVPACEKV